MAFWIFMVVMLLILPLIMLGCGKMFLKWRPKEINMLFGYRTTMSTKNKDTWNFAHIYCGKLWLKFWKYSMLFVLCMLFVIGSDEETIGNIGGIIMILQMTLFLFSIYLTEKELKKNFDKNGNRREL